MKQKKKRKKTPKKHGAMSATQKVAQLQRNLDALQHAASQMLHQAELKALYYARRASLWKSVARKQVGLGPVKALDHGPVEVSDREGVDE